MPIRSVVFLRLTACLLFRFTSLSLQAQTGSIAGTVTESLRKTLLTGAEITVEGSMLKTATGDSGRYTLLGVPAGKAKLTVSYLGLDPQSQEVTVTGGVTMSLDFSLSPSLKTTVTVQGEPILEGQSKALNDQMNSLTLVNLVAADQIGSFPDPNAAEAAQRIPGIIVQRDQGEGRYVLIRGTEPRLSATTINGERIGTTENTSRQIPLDTIPADLMGAIEITKVLTPDMEADSIGGRVNLITKRAPSQRHAGVTLGSGFNTLVWDDIKDYNGNYGQRLLDQKLGFIASVQFLSEQSRLAGYGTGLHEPGAFQPRPSGLRTDADAVRRYRRRRLPPFTGV